MKAHRMSIVGMITLVLCALCTPYAGAQQKPPVRFAGERVNFPAPGQPNLPWIQSPNGQFGLYVQTDGNVVVYDSNGHPAWSMICSNQVINGPAAYLVMQTDGNLVVYNASNQALNYPPNAPGYNPAYRCNTFTGGHTQTGDLSSVALENDGNIVINAAVFTGSYDRGCIPPYCNLPY